MGIINKIIEDIKNECADKEDFLSQKQEEVLKYYLNYHLNNLF